MKIADPMNTLQLQAINSFKTGMNCAQAVLTTFSDKYKIDKNVALSLSCGFGGGMGRLQETCGAVTGSFMVIGAHCSEQYTDNKDKKEKSYAMIQEFDRQFTRIHGSTNCSKLLQVDLRTSEGQRAFNENKLSTEVCEKCIADSVSIVESLL
jgi:C_GCAxxG_C_C family probable redox protein